MTGLIVMLLSGIMKISGIQIEDSMITETITNMGVLIGGVIAYIGRVRQGDITWWGKKN
jgi:hypothetical protein